MAIDPIELTRRLVAIPSISNGEDAVCTFVESRLKEEDWEVRTQLVPPDRGAPATEGRRNVLATSKRAEGRPKVVLTTHLDTVPPFIPLSEDDRYLYGRGTCDAKGIFAAMWSAADRLRAEGHHDVALLGVVGEETDSLGAKKVVDLLPAADWVVDGEPTEMRMASGAKGILSLRLRVRGQAGHSAYPERGRSAVHHLVQALAALLRAELPSDPDFGETTVNVGVLEGGVAPNVIAPGANAQVMIRLGAPSDPILEQVKSLVGPEVDIDIVSRSEPHRIHALPGRAHEVVRFGSDVPYLSRIGKPLLVGPGSIHDAHTAGEKVSKDDLLRAADLYVEVSKALLEASEVG